MAGKKMICLKKAVQGKAGLQSIARQEKGQGFAGGDEITVRPAPYAAEFSKFPVKYFILGEKDIQELRSDMGYQTEDQGGSFRKGEPVMAEEIRIGRFRPAQIRGGKIKYILHLGFLGKIQFNPGVKYSCKPVQFQLKVVGI